MLLCTCKDSASNIRFISIIDITVLHAVEDILLSLFCRNLSKWNLSTTIGYVIRVMIGYASIVVFLHRHRCKWYVCPNGFPWRNNLMITIYMHWVWCKAITPGEFLSLVYHAFYVVTAANISLFSHLMQYLIDKVISTPTIDILYSNVDDISNHKNTGVC